MMLKNLTPLPPSLVGKGEFKASLLVGERFGERFLDDVKKPNPPTPFPTREEGVQSLSPCRREVSREVFR
jgi:hypothetical protein